MMGNLYLDSLVDASDKMQPINDYSSTLWYGNKWKKPITRPDKGNSKHDISYFFLPSAFVQLSCNSPS